MENLNFDNLILTIGKNLHTVRNSMKLTLEAVADDLGTSHSVLSKIENGRYQGLSLNLLTNLCKYYKVTLAQILDIEGHQIFNYSQYIKQPSGNHTQTNNIAEGYIEAITALKEEIVYLKSQNEKLLNKIIKND